MKDIRKLCGEEKRNEEEELKHSKHKLKAVLSYTRTYWLRFSFLHSSFSHKFNP